MLARFELKKYEENYRKIMEERKEMQQCREHNSKNEDVKQLVLEDKKKGILVCMQQILTQWSTSRGGNPILFGAVLGSQGVFVAALIFFFPRLSK